jgi:hypothetical protein
MLSCVVVHFNDDRTCFDCLELVAVLQFASVIKLYCSRVAVQQMYIPCTCIREHAGTV